MATADIDAIQVYFQTTPVKTQAAQAIKDKFVTWVTGLSWLDKMGQAAFDLARNQRNDFNTANAVTDTEKQTVTDVATTGLSEEQMQGQPDRRLSDGSFPGPRTPPPPGGLASWTTIAWLGGGVAALGVVGYLLSGIARVEGK